MIDGMIIISVAAVVCGVLCAYLSMITHGDHERESMSREILNLYKTQEMLLDRLENIHRDTEDMLERIIKDRGYAVYHTMNMVTKTPHPNGGQRGYDIAFNDDPERGDDE